MRTRIALAAIALSFQLPKAAATPFSSSPPSATITTSKQDPWASESVTAVSVGRRFFMAFQVLRDWNCDCVIDEEDQPVGDRLSAKEEDYDNHYIYRAHLADLFDPEPEEGCYFLKIADGTDINVHCFNVVASPFHARQPCARGQVVDEAGVGVAHAGIALIRFDAEPGENATACWSDAEGLFACCLEPGAAPGPMVVETQDDDHGGSADAARLVTLDTGSVDLTAFPIVTRTGTHPLFVLPVFSDGANAGQIIEGVKIRATALAGPPSIFVATSKALGASFMLPPGAYKLTTNDAIALGYAGAQALAPSSAPSLVVTCPVGDAAPCTCEGGACELPFAHATATLTGQCVSDDAEASCDACVVIGSNPFCFNDCAKSIAPIGYDGTYSMAASEGVTQIQLWCDDRRAETLAGTRTDVSISAGQATQQDVRRHAAASTVAGLTVDANEQPVPGIPVITWIYADAGGLVTKQVSKDDGTFSIPLPALNVQDRQSFSSIGTMQVQRQLVNSIADPDNDETVHVGGPGGTIVRILRDAFAAWSVAIKRPDECADGFGAGFDIGFDPSAGPVQIADTGIGSVFTIGSDPGERRVVASGSGAVDHFEPAMTISQAVPPGINPCFGPGLSSHVWSVSGGCGPTSSLGLLEIGPLSHACMPDADDDGDVDAADLFMLIGIADGALPPPADISRLDIGPGVLGADLGASFTHCPSPDGVIDDLDVDVMQGIVAEAYELWCGPTPSPTTTLEPRSAAAPGDLTGDGLVTSYDVQAAEGFALEWLGGAQPLLGDIGPFFHGDDGDVVAPDGRQTVADAVAVARVAIGSGRTLWGRYCISITARPLVEGAPIHHVRASIEGSPTSADIEQGGIPSPVPLRPTTMVLSGRTALLSSYTLPDEQPFPVLAAFACFRGAPPDPESIEALIACQDADGNEIPIDPASIEIVITAQPG